MKLRRNGGTWEGKKRGGGVWSGNDVNGVFVYEIVKSNKNALKCYIE